jgi:hypothetical protein
MELEIEYEPTPAFKEAYNKLIEAIENLERVQGGEIAAITKTEMGWVITAGFSAEGFNAFGYTSGLKPRN